MAECEHKWKIIKQKIVKNKNLLGIESEDTLYHLQCTKCGDLKSRTCVGAIEE